MRRLQWGVHTAPLLHPYELSFGDLTSFEVVWVYAEDEDGRLGLGEAVALPGYSWETTGTIQGAVAGLCARADGLAATAIMQRCAEARDDHPFAASAVMAALEMPFFAGYADSTTRFPISAPVSGDWDLEKLRKTVEVYLASGYKFIKAKVGRDFNANAAAAVCLLTEWPSQHFRVVFDANQAYSAAAATAFAGVLRDCAGERLQWFEQPVNRRDWQAMEQICQEARVPIVLDECIYTRADVARAAAIGAQGVKLKLVKNFGIAETLSLARFARSLGLEVVFGNGVASDIGNLGEYLTLAAGEALFARPSECTGFCKLREPLLGSAVAVDRESHIRCSLTTAKLKDRIEQFARLNLLAAEPNQPRLSP